MSSQLEEIQSQIVTLPMKEKAALARQLIQELLCYVAFLLLSFMQLKQTQL